MPRARRGPCRATARREAVLAAMIAAATALGGCAGCGDNLTGPRDAAMISEPELPMGTPDLRFVPEKMQTVAVTMGDPGDPCVVEEQCVTGPGDRRLLKFSTVTANLGTADLHVGPPPAAGVSDDRFQWSPCHGHHHFMGYARFELVDAAGRVMVARKQSFCLQDDDPVLFGTPRRYSCADQGISRGWADVYSLDLPCQWIDVTGLPSGPYTLRVLVNPDRVLPESNYDNNVFTKPVQL